MFTKLLAAAAALLLAAGISVIAIAAPAEAHHTDLSATAACTSDGGWDITWSVINSENLVGTVTASDNAAVPVGTVLPANPSYYPDPSKSIPTTYTQHVTTNAPVTLDITVRWSNGNTNGKKITFNSFPAGCGTTLVTPKEPDLKLVSECGTSGSVTPVAVTGVEYATTFDPKTGDYLVVATPAENFTFSGPQSVTYQGNVGKYYECVTEAKPVLVVGECVYQADGTAAQREVSITFDNNASNKPVLFQIAGLPQYDRTVAAFDQYTVVLATTDASGGSYTVTAGGKSFVLDIAACPPYTKPTPLTRDESTEAFECASEAALVSTTTFTTDYSFDVAKREWVKQAEVAGTPVTSSRPLTPAEKTAECGVTITTEPTASACTTGTDSTTAFTRWIKIDADARVSYSARNTVTGDVTALTSDYTEVAAGKYIVSAVAATGYELQPARTWTFFVEDTSKCEPPTLPIVTPTYSTTPVTCTTAGTYTLGAVTPGTVEWTVNGVATPAGTYSVKGAQKLTLVASPAKSTDGLDPDWTNPTVLTFSAAATTCELETLAYTGGSQGSLLTLAGGMVFVGLGGLLVARRRWVARV